jgi:Holliday junction resolvase
MRTEERARIIFEAAEQLAWSDPKSISDLARRLANGLPAEDEFSVLISWLGRCKLVHKLDQLQFPRDSKRTFRVPDLLAIFEHKGKNYPVLIEVKTKEDNKLSWKPDYLNGLRNYGDLLGLPVLVAWKYRTFWHLFELRHFQLAHTNYNISFETATKQNLMSLLAGDFSFSLQSGLGLHFHMKKLEKTSDGWNVQIERAYFETAEGEQFNTAPGLFPLLLCIEPDSSSSEDDSYLTQSFVIPSEKLAQLASRSLERLARFAASETEAATWRLFLQGTSLPKLAEGFFDAVKQAKTAGFVRMIAHFVPHDKPSFLQ